MRITISTWAAAFAVVAAGTAAAPAMACGYGGCSPCGYVSPCGSYGYAGYQTLPNPEPVTRQYYYVNQGPTYSGPGQFAPVPTYQETAIGWRGYPRYDGGPYANPYNHYTYGYGYAPAVSGPVVFTPRFRPHYGYARRSFYARPRVVYGHRYGHWQQGGYHRPLRRAY